MIRQALLCLALTFGVVYGAYAQTISSALASPVSSTDLSSAVAAMNARITAQAGTAGVSSFNGQTGVVTFAAPAAPDLTPFARTIDLQNLAATVPSISGLDTTAARQADTAAVRALIPSLTPYAKLTDLSAAIAPLATQSALAAVQQSIPSTTGLVTAAQAAAAAPVQSVNGLKGAVTLAIPDLTGYARSTDITAAVSGLDTVAARQSDTTATRALIPGAAAIAAAAPVQSVNGQVGAVTLSIPSTAGLVTAAQAAAAAPVQSVNGQFGAVVLTIPSISGLATSAQLAAVQAQIPPVTDLGTFTVATLPACASNAKMTAWATDLFGGPGDRVICDGTNWKPVRPLALATAAAANTTLTALLSPPTLVLTGTLATGITATITMSTQYAYRGARFRVVRKATGLGSVVVALTTAITLTSNGWADFEFDGTAWVETASGTLL